MTSREVDTLSEEGAKDELRAILNVLDLLDDEDYFGSEGWRIFFNTIDTE